MNIRIVFATLLLLLTGCSSLLGDEDNSKLVADGLTPKELYEQAEDKLDSGSILSGLGSVWVHFQFVYRLFTGYHGNQWHTHEEDPHTTKEYYKIFRSNGSCVGDMRNLLQSNSNKCPVF